MASNPEDSVRRSDPVRADHQTPGSEDLGCPRKSHAKTVRTGSGLLTQVQDKAGFSTLAGEARSSLPQTAWGRPTEEQPALAVPPQLLRQQPALAVPAEGVLHSQHTMGQSGMEQSALAVPLASEE